MTHNVIAKFKGMTATEIKQNIKRFPFSVATFNVRYGVNLGSIMRACNVFAAKELIVIGDKHWDRRASIGVQNYETIVYLETFEQFLEYASNNKLNLVGVDYIEGESVSIRSITKYDDNTVFIMGSERTGLSQEVIEKCSKIIHIQQYGSIPSLNVAQATGIILNDWHEKYES